jgi:hypothetical protein
MHYKYQPGMRKVAWRLRSIENIDSSALFSLNDPLHPMQAENCAAETEYLLQQAASASTLSLPQNEARCAIKSSQMFGVADEP